MAGQAGLKQGLFFFGHISYLRFFDQARLFKGRTKAAFLRRGRLGRTGVHQ